MYMKQKQNFLVLENIGKTGYINTWTINDKLHTFFGI